MRKTYLITGAGSGIGLGMVKALLASEQRVIATVRRPENSQELLKLIPESKKNLQVEKLDVADETSSEDFKKIAKNFDEIDVLVNGAGIYPDDGEKIKNLSLVKVREAFEVNTLGPIRVVQALLPKFKKGSVVSHITSLMGSIEDNGSGGSYAYRMSKAALNMFNKSLSFDLSDSICVVLHPGWVKTKMGGPNAPTTVDESVNGLLKVIHGLKKSDTGKFFDFRGKELPW